MAFSNMTVEQRSALLNDNIKKLENSVKNIKCPGVLKKRRRQLRTLLKSSSM